MNEKFDWKKYLTLDNIERYAPVAAFFPIGMSIVTSIVGVVLSMFFGCFAVGCIIRNILVGLLRIIFCAGSIGAAVGLVYVALKTKDTSRVNTWIAPAAVICSAISCIGIAFHVGVLGWLFGIISVVAGVELLARITIAANPMDTPFNPGGAFDVYKKYYEDYKAKNPTTKDLEKTEVINPEMSYFDGNGAELFGYTILGTIICVVTCGIAAPWIICKIYSWKLSHTVINGRRLTFDGTGASLLGHWIVWELLTLVTCGIYSFFMYVALRKWEMKHTYIDGEAVVPNESSSYFDGNSFEYLGYAVLGGILICVTCGIATPWAVCMIQRWDVKHQNINNRRLVFSGTGLGFLGEYIIIALLSLITCGIYSSWGQVRLLKYITRHTDFVN